MMRFFTVLFLCLSILPFLRSQTLSGRVIDAQGSPLAYATLRMLRAVDSTQVAAGIADENGRFEWKQLPSGNYLLRVALIGYSDVYSEPFLWQNTRDSILQPLVLNPVELKEVTIRADKHMVENQADKTVINVDGSTAAGNSAFDVLQHAPGVVVTPQENIMLYGKGGTLVLIDGRRLQMSDAELAVYLKSLPAEDIRSIELIAHPSAKYDADGAAGIIHIRLRKKQNPGMNGALSCGNSQSVHHRAYAAANFNYVTNKFNVFGNGNLTNAAQTVNQRIERRVGQTDFSQFNPKTENWTGRNLKTGADWYLNPEHTVGFIFNGSDYNNITTSRNSTIVRNAETAQTDSSLLGVFRNPECNRRLNFNLNYRYADTSGTELTFDADRIRFNMNGNNQMNNEHFNAGGMRIGSDEIATDLHNNIAVWSLKSDFSKRFKHAWKIEAGAKITRTDNQSEVFSRRSLNDLLPAPDTGRSNRILFTEKIAAAYLNVHKQYGNWELQAGLRAENTSQNGLSEQIDGNQKPLRTARYLDLFPSLFAQYQIGQKGNSVVFSAGRRIDRPVYQDLNPFIWQLDPYTSERGNPALKPAYVQNAALKFNYHWAASIELAYAHTHDAVSTVARLEGDQAFTQPENLSTADNFSLNVNAPTSWGEGYCWLGVWHNRFRSNLPEGRLDRRNWGGGAWISRQISLPKKTKLDVSGWAQFPGINGMFRNKGIWSMDISVKKIWLNDKLVLKAGITDVFHSQRWTDTIRFANVNAVIMNRWESQAFVLGLSWKFGNQKLKSRVHGSSVERENARIKGGKGG